MATIKNAGTSSDHKIGEYHPIGKNALRWLLAIPVILMLIGFSAILRSCASDGKEEEKKQEENASGGHPTPPRSATDRGAPAPSSLASASTRRLEESISLDVGSWTIDVPHDQWSPWIQLPPNKFVKFQGTEGTLEFLLPDGKVISIGKDEHKKFEHMPLIFRLRGSCKKVTFTITEQ